MAEFSEEYVKKLREENASWRTKVRTLEADQTNNEVSVELAKQGIEANPGWVEFKEGQTVAEAVASFKTQYPNLTKEPVVQEPELDLDFTPEPLPKVTPRALAPSTPKSNVPKNARSTRITTRNIKEIRKDPTARAKVRGLYRDLLQKGSNQGE